MFGNFEKKKKKERVVYISNGKEGLLFLIQCSDPQADLMRKGSLLVV